MKTATADELEAMERHQLRLEEEVRELSSVQGRLVKLIAESAERHRAELDGLQAEVERLKAATKWQPIETAPRDGTWVLCYSEGVISHAFWESNEFDGDCHWGGKDWYYPKWSQPTHWMPAPAPPEGTEEE